MKINRHLLPMLVAMLTVLSAVGQTTSPYSMYGYGLIGDRATSMQRQMGGVGYAMNSGRQINVMNPASFSYADSLTFLWDIGADLSFLHSKEGTLKENSTGGGLEYLTMQFPITKHIGASAGLLPITSVGYAFGNDIQHGAKENQGSGGINSLYLGFGGNYAGVAIGASFSYRFGNIQNDVYSTPTGSAKTLFEHVMQVRDWGVDFGLQYSVNVSKYDRLTLGVSYSPKKTLLGKTWVMSQDMSTITSSTGSTTVNPPDTLVYTNMRNKYYMPNSFGGGINYTRTKSYRLMVEADFTFEQWKDAKYSPLYDSKGNVVFQGMEFNNRTKYAIGAEFVPRLRGNYGQRIIWRCGGYYTKDYLRINGNDVKEYGVTAGLGFPTLDQKTIINLGFEWRHRQTSPQTLLTENYFNITLGVNFNEVWFWQRKIK